MRRIIIFASGSGTNAENIINYFDNSALAHVTYVVTNNSNAGVLDRADRLGVAARIFSKADMKNAAFLEFLTENADFIVLAGFLLKVPDAMLKLFPDRIINIHPALLPKYGGKGMYGMNVHKAVVENKETASGITIHYVNENYDEGGIIFQKSVGLTAEDTPDDVAAKIHELEQKNFPKVLEELLQTT